MGVLYLHRTYTKNLYTKWFFNYSVNYVISLQPSCVDLVSMHRKESKEVAGLLPILV